MKQVSIGMKIWLSIAILIAGYGVSTYLSFLTGQSTQYQLKMTSGYVFPAYSLAQKSEILFKEQVDLYSEAVLFGEASSIGAAQENADAIYDHLSQITLFDGISAEKKVETTELMDKLSTFSSTAATLYTGWIEAEAEGGDTDSYIEKVGDLGVTTELIKTRLSALASSYSELLNENICAAGLSVKRGIILSLYIFIAVVIVAISLMAAIILQSIIKPINRVIGELSVMSNQVGSSAAEIATVNHSQAQSTSSQAAAIEETSSALVEMAAMTDQNMQNAAAASQLMDATNNVMNDAHQAMNQLGTSMIEISQASDQTSKIIKTIDEIAFQTNLLALNAAVEAARAGEAGKGFAVVAEEVRSLAKRSADAAKDTTNLIEGTSAKVREGQSYVQSTGKAFTALVASSSKVSALIKEISVATSEQSFGINQINGAMASIDLSIQSVAASTVESSSSANEMESEAVKLNEVIANLIGLMKGS